jgi:hypothetical protein
MTTQYYGIAVQSTTASVGVQGHSDAFSGQAYSISNQRVRTVLMSFTAFVGAAGATQTLYALGVTSSGVVGVAQLL